MGRKRLKRQQELYTTYRVIARNMVTEYLSGYWYIFEPPKWWTCMPLYGVRPPGKDPKA